MNKKNFPDEETFEESSEDILFYMDCPCKCSRIIRILLSPEKPDQKFHIPDIANKFWRNLVDEYGLKSAIEFLHENA